jgi:hypothetical protein
MRFLCGMFAGSFLATGFAVATVNTVFKPSPDLQSDYEREQRARTLAEFRAGQVERELANTKLLLDAYRRSTRDPVHPKGVDVPPADRIPAPAVPLPVNPTAAPGKE